MDSHLPAAEPIVDEEFELVTLEESGDIGARQIRFCREYLRDYRQREAAVRAGYSEGSAHVSASRMLARPEIQAYIEKLKKAQFLRLSLDADQVLAQMARIAFADIGNIMTDAGALNRLEDIDEDTRAAIESIKVTKRPTGEFDDDGKPIYEDVAEYRMASKKPVLELLAKHIGVLEDSQASSVINNYIIVPPKGPMPDDQGNIIELDEDGNPMLGDDT